VLVPEADLPVELPEFINTTGNPLDAAEEWKETSVRVRPATRETDTMDTFVDSSWYFLRYVSPGAEDVPFDLDRANDWMPVDQYVGGIEHAVMHLLYSRFVTKVLADEEGLAHREPFTNLLAQGMVQLEGEKMSKSKGNTVSPQRIVDEYGADTARLFMMQAAQPERDFDWAEEGVKSTHRFGAPDGLGRGVRGGEAETASSDADRDTIDDLRRRRGRRRGRHRGRGVRRPDVQRRAPRGAGPRGDARSYRGHADPHPETYERGLDVAVRLLAPVVPHLAEELWETLDREGFVVEAEWPTATVDRETVERRRRLVANTREDVRDIVEVAGIEDPERIDVVVAPDWKYDALSIAIDSDADNLISELMGSRISANRATTPPRTAKICRRTARRCRRRSRETTSTTPFARAAVVADRARVRRAGPRRARRGRRRVGGSQGGARPAGDRHRVATRGPFGNRPPGTA